MNNESSVLSVKSVSRSFEGKKIISDININVEKGEIVSLLGMSGSGKTTLFNIISGILEPDCGDVYYHGIKVTSKPGKISYMLQDDLLFEHKKVIDNIALSLVIKGEKKKKAQETALGYLGIFGLDGVTDKYPAALSGGMRQRAALMRTYLTGSDVLLLDEPFSALDAITKRELHLWYLEISKKLGLSTVFITHDIDEAVFLSDRICVLSGTPSRVTSEFKITYPTEYRKGFELTNEFVNVKKEIAESLAHI